MFLGPSPQVLEAVIGAARPAVHRIIVVLCNGPDDNLSMIPILASEPDLKVLCLSEMQRSSFGMLADRIEVVTGGIPVGHSVLARSGRKPTATNARPRILRYPAASEEAAYRPDRLLSSQ